MESLSGLNWGGARVILSLANEISNISRKICFDCPTLFICYLYDNALRQPLDIISGVPGNAHTKFSHPLVFYLAMLLIPQWNSRDQSPQISPGGSKPTIYTVLNRRYVWMAGRMAFAMPHRTSSLSTSSPSHPSSTESEFSRGDGSFILVVVPRPTKLRLHRVLGPEKRFPHTPPNHPIDTYIRIQGPSYLQSAMFLLALLFLAVFSRSLLHPLSRLSQALELPPTSHVSLLTDTAPQLHQMLQHPMQILQQLFR